MPKIAILTSSNMMPDSDGLRSDFFELEEQMGKLTPAFAALNYQTELVLWNEAGERAGEFSAILPLIVWDYFEGNNTAEFLEQIHIAAQKCPVFNPPSILKLNSNKQYLDMLQTKGAPVIQALVTDTFTPEQAEQAFERFSCEKIVVKPQIGAGAWRQALIEKGGDFPAESELPPGRAIVQPFLPSVLTEGEYSFLYFDGGFSHAVNKRPKSGDYRIQSSFGGRELPYEPKREELETAQTVLSYLDEMPLYARVDLLRGLDGRLKLIELEMIEPYLYLAFAEGEGANNVGAQALAKAVVKRIK